jgi:hypothetical protein
MPVLQLSDGNLIAVTDAEPRFGQSGEGELGSHVSEPDWLVRDRGFPRREHDRRSPVPMPGAMYRS